MPRKLGDHVKQRGNRRPVPRFLSPSQRISVVAKWPLFLGGCAFIGAGG